MQSITLSAHLGSDDEGRRRKQALQDLAAQAGHFWNGLPSTGRWLCHLADNATARPEPENLSADLLHITERMTPRELDDLEDAILIKRERMLVRRLRAAGFSVTDGDNEDWAWMDHVLVSDPAFPDTVYAASPSDCRRLLDTAREMDSPAVAYARWKGKMRE